MTIRSAFSTETRPHRAAGVSRRGLLTGAGAAALLPSFLPSGAAQAQILGADGGTAYQRAIGETEVTALLDGFLALGRDVLINVEPETVSEALTSEFLDPEGMLSIGVTAHLLRAGDRAILVDTGAADAFGPNAGRIGAGLAAAGVAPSDIGLILLTHMHPDHIGGMLEDGAPAFPNAEVRVAEADLDFWTDEGIAGQAPEAARAFFALARDVAAAYGERIVPFSGETDVAPGIASVPLPGHTPGHTGYRVSSGDAQLLLWADIVHVAAVQFAHPQAGLTFDVDPAQAAETRRRTLDMVAADRTLFAGAHLPYPTFGHAVARQDAYAWEPEAWQYR